MCNVCFSPESDNEDDKDYDPWHELKRRHVDKAGGAGRPTWSGRGKIRGCVGLTATSKKATSTGPVGAIFAAPPSTSVSELVTVTTSTILLPFSAHRHPTTPTRSTSADAVRSALPAVSAHSPAPVTMPTRSTSVAVVASSRVLELETATVCRTCGGSISMLMKVHRPVLAQRIPHIQEAVWISDR